MASGDLRTGLQMSRLFAATLALALASSTLVQAAAHRRPVSTYVAELNRQCPGAHLEDMPAGDLEMLMEVFEKPFSPAQKHRVQDAVGLHCARVEAGLSCANAVSLDIYRKQGLLKSFVHGLCTQWVCQGVGDCTPR